MKILERMRRQRRLNILRGLRVWRDRCLKCNNEGRLRFELLSHCDRVTTGYVGGYARYHAECSTHDHSTYYAFGEEEILATKSLAVKVYKHVKASL